MSASKWLLHNIDIDCTHSPSQYNDIPRIGLITCNTTSLSIYWRVIISWYIEISPTLLTSRSSMSPTDHRGSHSMIWRSNSGSGYVTLQNVSPTPSSTISSILNISICEAFVWSKKENLRYKIWDDVLFLNFSSDLTPNKSCLDFRLYQTEIRLKSETAPHPWLDSSYVTRYVYSGYEKEVVI